MELTGLKKKESRLVWSLIIATIALGVIGVAFIYSATVSNESTGSLPFYKQRYFMQIVWYIFGAIAGGAICIVSYHSIARWSYLFYWIIIAMLALVLIAGATRYGAKRWFDLGFFQIQPSEFAKLAFIVALANYLSRPIEELKRPKILWGAIGMAVLPFLLIIKEPDLGSAIVFLPVCLAMLYVAEAPTGFLRTLIICVVAIVGLFLVDILFAPPNWQIKLQDYQRRRLLVYFGKDYAPADATPAERKRLQLQQLNDSYNIRQALISVGSGGILGKGWCQGTQTALGYLPRAVAHNDFIFSVIAEESGFVGSIVVVALYGVILFSGITVASSAGDRLGKLIAVGVVVLIFSHIFINIGMNIRFVPVTGVPLPLISYGGSSVICFMVAIGLLENVYIHRRN
ncbi:MAG: FtsW/RodA/SpoVE family cell cycle protein [Verrucomicrobiia bacterium]